MDSPSTPQACINEMANPKLFNIGIDYGSEDGDVTTATAYDVTSGFLWEIPVRLAEHILALQSRSVALEKELSMEKERANRYYNFLPACQICDKRKGETKHHLVPRLLGGAKEDKSMWGKRKIIICRPCHNAIHHLYSEKELALKFRTLDSFNPVRSRIISCADTKYAKS